MNYQEAFEPRDEYNLLLESHVHPADYVNPKPADTSEALATTRSTKLS